MDFVCFVKDRFRQSVEARRFLCHGGVALSRRHVVSLAWDHVVRVVHGCGG